MNGTQLVATNRRSVAPAGEFLSWEVSKSTGASLRQLQWWHERGVVVPRIVKHSRFYTLDQVEQIRRLVQLRKAGASLHDIRKFKLLTSPWKSVQSIRKPFLLGDVLLIPKRGY